jgi:ubiquinone/menaquinone biosynthesis C-methylase UbiE
VSRSTRVAGGSDGIVALVSREYSDRLQREIAFHRDLAPNAEVIWNWDSPAGQARAQRRADFFVAEGRLQPGRRALEFGCGTGVFLRKVARSGATIHAVDLSIDLIRQARTYVAELANVTIERGNAEQLPYRDGSFDAVYGSSILHHLDLDRALAEVYRVLRPGGRFAFAEPNILNPQVAIMFKVDATKGYYGVSPDEMAFSRFQSARALRQAGFRDFVVKPHDFLHPATPRALVPLVSRIGLQAERVPLLREIAGSQFLFGTR